MNSIAITITAVTLVAGTVIYLDHNQTEEMKQTVRSLQDELAGVRELRNIMDTELKRQAQVRMDAQAAANRFAGNQMALPSADYGQPLKPFQPFK